MKNFNQFGMAEPEILLPKNIDISSWSVIACDQYTQDRDYWKKAAESTQGKPSTLNMILPEVYLGDGDRKERIQNINRTMNEYLSNGTFAPAEKEFIYIERTTGYGRIRKGLVTAIDLETYEWKPMSKALIRATEATIVDRIPPRKEIRKGAPVESPHIMLLVNDPKHLLVEGTGTEAKKNQPVYSGDLMLNSGSITGWAVKSDAEIDKLYSALEEIKKDNTESDGSVFMFAVGDGNHSLATAKAVWDEYKEEHPGVTDSPVRYALVEIVNIYDEGLTFEPIHRVMFGSDAESVIDFVKANLGGSVTEVSSEEELDSRIKASKASFGFVFLKDGKQKYVVLDTAVTELAVSRLQPVLDDFMKDKKIEIDYIHGSEEVFRLGKEENSLSIMLPPIAKDSFFATISGRGPLPRKSFSMGEASEKRFYLECRKLFAE